MTDNRCNWELTQANRDVWFPQVLLGPAEAPDTSLGSRDWDSPPASCWSLCDQAENHILSQMRNGQSGREEKGRKQCLGNAGGRDMLVLRMFTCGDELEKSHPSFKQELFTEMQIWTRAQVRPAGCA